MVKIFLKKLFIQIFIITLVFEFFSFIATSFNLLIFNEKPIYFKSSYTGETWKHSDPEIGPWHNNFASARHKKTCFDINYFSNNIGARDNKDYYPKTFEKSIVLIGDSFAEGYGIKLENTFSKIIEKKLNKNVINLGSSGTNPRHHYLRFKKFAKNKNFEEIVYLFFPLNDFIEKNEFTKTNVVLKTSIFENFKKFLSNFTYSFNTIRTIKFLVINKDKSFKNRGYQYKDKESIDYTFDFINKVMKSENKRKTLIIIPAKKDIRFNSVEKNYKKLHWFKKLQYMSGELGFDIIDLIDVFNIKKVNKYFHSCDGHWSSYGNFAAANYFLSHRK